MAIAFVNAWTENSTTFNGFTSGSRDTSGITFLVAVLAEANAQGSISDSKSNTWTELTTYSGSARTCSIWYVTNPTVGTGHTITISGTGNSPCVSWGGFTGVATSSPFDVENGNGAVFATTVQPGTVTPSAANSLVLTGVCTSIQAAGVSVDSPFTLATQGPTTGFGSETSAMAYEIQTTATARNPTWTRTNSADLASPIAVFKVAGVTSLSAFIGEPQSGSSALSA